MRLDRLIAEASVLAGGKHQCAVLGHVWTFVGGKSCDCAPMNGNCCSIPVYECSACGDCDYGENPEAAEIRLECECVAELN